MSRDITEIAAEAYARQAREVAERLLPQGKLVGHEWTCGDVHGNPGNSLKVNVRTGKWKDFSASEKGGDLIELWRQVSGKSLPDTLKEIRAYLGIEEPRFEQTAQKKTYQKPAKPQGAHPARQGTAVEQYLRGERAIPTDVIMRYQIAEADVLEGEGERGPYKIPGPWILFPYLRRGANGKIECTNIKWLHVERRPDGKKRTKQEKDAEPGLFGWHALPEDARSVIICEGEIDALTWARFGYYVLSVPMGAGGGHKADWIEHDWERLEQFEEIYLNYDADVDRGVIMEVAKRLGRHRCRIIRLPHKDINECVAKHGMGETEIGVLVDRAELCQPATLENAAEFTEAVIKRFYPEDEAERGVSVVFARDDQFRMRSQELTLFTGINGHGKSAMVSQMALLIMDRGMRACIASMEMPPRETLGRAVQQICQTGKPSIEQIRRAQAWLGERLWVYNVQGSTTPDALLDAFTYARRRFGCWLFIIDSLMRCGISGEDLDKQGSFVKQLCAFAEAEECHVILIAHARKPQDESKPVGKLDVKGSGDISDNAYNCFSLWRNKGKESKYDSIVNDPAMDGLKREEKLAALRNQPDALLICDKQRNGSGMEGKIRLWFNPFTVSYRHSRDGWPPPLLTADRPQDMRGEDQWEML